MGSKNLARKKKSVFSPNEEKLKDWGLIGVNEIDLVGKIIDPRRRGGGWGGGITVGRKILPHRDGGGEITEVLTNYE